MSGPQTPYGSVPGPSESHLGRGYGGSGVNDFAQGNPSAVNPSPLAQSQQNYQSGQFHEDFDAGTHGSSVVGDEPVNGARNRSASTASTAVAQGQAAQGTPSRNNTLRKKSSVRRTGSLKRSSSRKSLAAGSITGVGGGRDTEDYQSVFYTPVPTQGSPTEILANRFQAWRQLLKSLITYFREIQNSYDARAKAVSKVQNTIANITHPSVFITDNGLGEATRILDDYHKHSITEATKSRDIENDVIGALTGLRSDLSQKIKEIKSLSGDFKNSVDKEKEATRRAVDQYQSALQHANHEDASATGKNDPFVVKLGVDRAVEKQIDEENYLHRAYLNLESSGRELESIVVGEIQKAYNALAGILKREGDDAYSVVDSLRSGPISMPKDQEWDHFVRHDPHFVSSDVPVRRIEDITYPGKLDPAAAEIRAGMLERKSKYLKSYTPGWYVLSPTHLHEFKSADKIYTQPPVMSLYLPDQRLGSHSEAGSSSQKFMLKGKQAGGAHRGHSWVFRAESYDTMLAWFNDIKVLTEKSGEERTAFVRQHARSVSGNDRPRSISSDGLEEDEADAVPYSADAASLAEQNPVSPKPQRPLPGGRFPSDMNIHRSHAPLSPSSEDNSDRDVVAAAAALPSYQRDSVDENPYHLKGIDSGSRAVSSSSTAPVSYDDDQDRYMAQRYDPNLPQQQPVAHSEPAPVPIALPAKQPLGSTLQQQQQQPPVPARTPSPSPQYPTQADQYAAQQQQAQQAPNPPFSGGSGQPAVRHNSTYGDWLAPAALGAGAGAGALGTEAYHRHQRDAAVPEDQDNGLDQEQHREAFPTAAQPIDAQLASEPPAAGFPTASQPTEREIASPPLGATATTTPAPVPAPPAPTPAPAAATSPNEPTYILPISAPTSNGAPTSASGTFLGYEGTGKRIETAAMHPQPPQSTAPLTSNNLGGLEQEGAHETGRFPTVVRHDTDMSVSRLHVPGEFPKRG